MECVKIQGKWAKYFECYEGRDSGSALYEKLVLAWKNKNIKNIVHILYDCAGDEIYHALYMKQAMEEAGIFVKLVSDLKNLSYNKHGDLVDLEGITVKHIWKTWAWQTVVEQMRINQTEDHNAVARSPSLADILLTADIQVYEPLWTLIPSNKAILVVLWHLYPKHPYLLNTQYTLNADLI